MARLAKRLAVLAVAGTLTVTSLTGCGTINTDETVATVGDEEITLGVANFYARLQQAQYETYYASMMGTTAEEMWARKHQTIRHMRSRQRRVFLRIWRICILFHSMHLTMMLH